MSSELRLPTLALPGLSPDSLGSYLASLGLLRVLSRKWPSARIAWRHEVLQLVGGPPSLDALLDELLRVASECEWTRYDKAWSEEQKKGTKAKSGAPLALWQATAPESYLELFAAHAVPHARVSFNPLLGSGGNAGRRDFSAGWHAAVKALEGSVKAFSEAEQAHEQARLKAIEVRDDAYAKADAKHQAAVAKLSSARMEATRAKSIARAEEVRTRAYAKADEKHRDLLEKGLAARLRLVRPRDELGSLLLGRPSLWMLEKLGAGSWFSHATKRYNSGQSSAREGQVSPWAMALACEGLVFFAGGASRRLGASSRASGAFPFVTQPIAASAEMEADRLRGEIWIPLWTRPMTLAESSTLFSRGRAELRGRGATTPAAFATAIRHRGVDAGVSEFRRFTLGKTTSANTFEPRLEARFALDAGSGARNAATARTLGRVTRLIEQRGFPHDGKRFVGLRGPIEAALLDVAAQPDASDRAVALLDTITAALDRIDRNRSFRAGEVCWEPLPPEWLPSVFADESPGVEARLALSLVSAFPIAQPFATYRFGVEWNRGRTYRRYTHVETPPGRWVWGLGEVARALGAVLTRRLLDQERTLDKAACGRAPLPAAVAHVGQWLAGDIDESLFAAWLGRLALFDWRRVPQELRSLIRGPSPSPRADGMLALLGLATPLVDQRPLRAQPAYPDDLLAAETGARTTEAARKLVTLIHSGNLDAATRLAASRYAMAGARLASFGVPWSVRHPERLLAALNFTISDRDRAVLFERWLIPRRQHQGAQENV